MYLSRLQLGFESSLLGSIDCSAVEKRLPEEDLPSTSDSDSVSASVLAKKEMAKVELEKL